MLDRNRIQPAIAGENAPMDLEIVQTALHVLRACVTHSVSAPEDVMVLRKTMGAQTNGMPVDELARTVIERYLRESKTKAANL